MKLATFVNDTGSQAIGVVDSARKSILDLQAAHRDVYGSPNPFFHDMLALIASGDEGLERVREIARKSVRDGHRSQLDKAHLLAPIPVPPQLRDCNNFEQHMRGA